LKVCTELIDVVVILRSQHKLITVLAALHVFAVKAVLHVLTILQIVSQAVFRIVSVVFLKRMLKLQFPASLLALLVLRIGTKIDFLQPFLICFLCKLLVSETVLLLPESNTQEAVTAPYAVSQKRTEITIGTILTTGKGV
jgi:hypothetical protein